MRSSDHEARERSRPRNQALRASRRVGYCIYYHVLPPNSVPGQVDRDSGAFYPAGLSKCYSLKPEPCKDPLPPVPMAPRSDSLVPRVFHR